MGETTTAFDSAYESSTKNGTHMNRSSERDELRWIIKQNLGGFKATLFDRVEKKSSLPAGKNLVVSNDVTLALQTYALLSG